VRIDQLDRSQSNADVITYPKIIHFGIRPAQLSYAGDATYVLTDVVLSTDLTSCLVLLLKVNIIVFI